jgi:hypothetical protein
MARGHVAGYPSGTPADIHRTWNALLRSGTVHRRSAGERCGTLPSALGRSFQLRHKSGGREYPCATPANKDNSQNSGFSIGVASAVDHILADEPIPACTTLLTRDASPSVTADAIGRQIDENGFITAYSISEDLTAAPDPDAADL